MLCRLAILTTPGYRERTTPDGCSDAIHRFKANVVADNGNPEAPCPSPRSGVAGYRFPQRPAHPASPRPPGRSARARPPGRAQQAEPDRRAGEDTTQASHASAGAAGALIS